MIMFGYLIIISINFYILFFYFLLWFSLIEKMYQTLKENF